MKTSIWIFLLTICINTCYSHDQVSTATYLGNEAVLISHENSKIVFDPFFHNNYNIYQKVPQVILDKMFENEEPFANISAIFTLLGLWNNALDNLSLDILRIHYAQLISVKQKRCLYRNSICLSLLYIFSSSFHCYIYAAMSLQ